MIHRHQSGNAGGARARSDAEHGQAMVETLAALLFLAPLGLAVHYLGRWHDIQHATVSAARYAAMAAVASAGSSIARDIESGAERRFFSSAPDRFGSAANMAPGGVAAGRPAWRTPAGDTDLIDSEAGPTVLLGRVAQPAAVARTEGLALGMIAPAAVLGAGAFDLQRSAALRAEAIVPLRAISATGASLLPEGVRLQEHLEVLVDAWGASDAQQVAGRVGAFVPATRIGEAVALLAPLRWAITLFEPSFARFCPGRIEPDIVPDDRLSGARRAPLDLRNAPC
jgi:hypothetical protein